MAVAGRRWDGESIELGQKLLEGELRKHDLGQAIRKSEEMQKAQEFFGGSSLDDLYAFIGHGKIFCPSGRQ